LPRLRKSRVTFAIPLLSGPQLQSLKMLAKRIPHQRRAVLFRPACSPIRGLQQLFIQNDLDRFHGTQSTPQYLPQVNKGPPNTFLAPRQRIHSLSWRSPIHCTCVLGHLYRDWSYQSLAASEDDRGLGISVVGQSHLIGALIGAAFGDDERDVVVLFVWTVTLDFIDYCRDH